MSKFKYSATTPDGAKTATRGSDRVYTHALAVWFPSEKQYVDRRWIHSENGADVVVPAGLDLIFYGTKGDGVDEDRSSAAVGRRVDDSVAAWGIVSFHGSAELAAKAGRQWKRSPHHQVVPVEVL